MAARDWSKKLWKPTLHPPPPPPQANLPRPATPPGVRVDMHALLVVPDRVAAAGGPPGRRGEFRQFRLGL